MATKTVSIDEEAYERLVRARRHSKESFSKVIHRARWDEGVRRCGDLLTRAHGRMSIDALDLLDEAQSADARPADKWKH